MSRKLLNRQVNELFERGQWDEARALLEKERARDPGNHWLITQTGVTFYEQRKYKDALRLFLESLRGVPDCPLTLWNLAGTLDAIKKHADARRIYTWLLASATTPEEDPCWEDQAWTDSLKADALFRLGVCYQNLGKTRKAEQCYRQYLNVLLMGIKGTYASELAMEHIRALHSQDEAGSELRKAVNAALEGAGAIGKRTRPAAPPRFNAAKLLARG